METTSVSKGRNDSTFSKDSDSRPKSDDFNIRVHFVGLVRTMFVWFILSTVIFVKALLIVISWCVTYHIMETEKLYNEQFSLLDEAYNKSCKETYEKIDKEWF